MQLSLKANGNVPPARFVKPDTSGDGLVLVAGAGERCLGISQPGTRRTPYSGLDDGFAAIAGEDLQVFGVGERPMLELGGTVAFGDRLKSGALGVGVVTTTNLDEWGAIALAAGVSGQLIQVEVVQFGQISAA